ncbi:MAG: hypothetical protein J0I43_08970 [Microbacterium sp.]|uniref:MarR family winged helix-turn-helix transcriptional regulator n=1 Tax=Microbacterium sp. TaxID=51671 RepID=UPI001AD53AFD|nr:hypothetical protein [Microbacterium sp.]MBN9177480.1 hypothetical protein [Microbacterium sp.]
MENSPDTTPARPFGYWLRAADRLLAREFASAFEQDGASRRDWRLLSLLAGDASSPALRARLEHRGGKKLRGLIERGWVAETDGAWTLTDEGRAAHARLAEAAGDIRARVSGAVSPEDFATTLASLEAIAIELGWNPDERMPRGPRGRRGFGPGRRGPAFGPAFGPGLRPGFGPGHHRGFGPDQSADGGCGGDHHGHAGHAGHRGHRGGHHGHHGHAGRAAETAYERGFDAGFQRGATTRDA